MIAGKYASRKTKTGSDLGVQRVELAIRGTARSFVCLRGHNQDHNPRGLSHAQLIFWVRKEQSETYRIYTRYKREMRTGHPLCLPCGISRQAQSLRMIWAATGRAGYTSGYRESSGHGSYKSLPKSECGVAREAVQSISGLYSVMGPCPTHPCQAP